MQVRESKSEVLEGHGSRSNIVGHLVHTATGRFISEVD